MSLHKYEPDFNKYILIENKNLGVIGIILSSFFLYKILFILFMRDTGREAETQAVGEAGSPWGARCKNSIPGPQDHVLS